MKTLRNFLFIVALLIVAAVASRAQAADLAGGECPNARGICISQSCGDINGDGKLLVSDAQALIYLLLGLAQPGDVTNYGTICEATACNANGCYDTVVGFDGVCLFEQE